MSVGYALVAALFPPLTPAAAVAVLVPGAVVLGLWATRRAPARSPAAAAPRAATLVWLVLAGLGTVWWVLAFAWGNDADHPTLSLLLDPVLETYPARVLGYALWLAAGRWLVTR